MSSAEQARAFAGALLGDHGEMLNDLRLTLTTFASGEPGARTHWMPAQADVIASAITRAAAASNITGVYVGVGLTRGLRAIDPATGLKYKRLAKADVDGLAWLWVDLDVAGAAHGHKMPLLPDKATAIALVNSLGVPPTVLVDTGHGIQAHWRLREPFIYGCVDYDDDGVPIIDESKVAADRKAGEELAWAWVKSFLIRAKLMGEAHIPGGWHVDPTTDPSRLVRCPGSYNRKVEGDHRLVVALECDGTRRYDIDDLRAVLMPEKLLEPYRYDSDILTGVLAGVDLAGLWAAAKTFPGHEPPWLTNLFEMDVAPELEALWRGERDADYRSDDSSIDMALIRSLLKWRLTPADAAQAVMCRRLRRCEPGKKIDKVDPSQRQGYLAMTIGKVAASIKDEEDREAKRGEIADEMAEQTVVPKPAPSVLQAAPDLGVDDDDPGPDEPPSEEDEPPVADPQLPLLECADPYSASVGQDPALVEQPPTDVGGGEPTSNENAVTLEVGAAELAETAVGVNSDTDNERPREPDAPSLRALPAPQPDPHDAHPDALRAPRQGIDDSIPAMYDESEKADHLTLAAQLGLPSEVVIRAVGERRLAGEDEIRVWFYRRETPAVPGGRWRPNTVAATRWHPKSDWDGPQVVAGFLRHDLHLFTQVARRWAHSDNPHGLRLLYKLARWMPAGTPEDIVTLALLALLRKTTGTGLFSTARTTRDPWVESTEAVWVPWVNIQDAMRQLGHKAMAATALNDTLAELRAKVVSPMRVPEGAAVVHDAEQWVRIPVELIDAELWAEVGMRAVDRDAQDKRNDMRAIRP